MLLSDIDIAARTIDAEARSESFRGLVGVALVMVNRWHSGNPRDHTLAATCLRWKQFSCWLPSDPNCARMKRIGYSDVGLRRALRALLLALDATGTAEDWTKNSLHYHTTAIRPTWAAGKRPVIVEGNHAFYNDVE